MHFFKIVGLLMMSSFTIGKGGDCPDSNVNLEYLQVFHHVAPLGNTSAGYYTEISGINDLDNCLLHCCHEISCSAVFFYKLSCYHIQCKSVKLCQPLLRKGNKFNESYMALFRLQDTDYPFQVDPYLYQMAPSDDDFTISNDSHRGKTGIVHRTEGSELSFSPHPCETGIGTDCPKDEHCVSKNSRARQGTCQCDEGMERSNSGVCVPAKRDLANNGKAIEVGTASSILPVTNTTVQLQTNELNIPTTNAPELHHLVVSAGENKIIQLPENEVILSAYTVPKEPDGEHYKYEWILVSHPKGDLTGSTKKDTNTPTLKLSGLQEGNYTFKVSVTSSDAFAEAFVNITVLPAKRINKFPVAIINPSNQTVKLPNTDTVLDGSSSTDDDKIARYVWETVSAPIEYKPQLTNTATLQLKNLMPGFYRFMLTVTDSDGASNSTYGNVTVIKETDYPPTANAGTDIIIHLPQNNITLNGSLSTDDKGIKTWEWYKGADTNKAVDMQDTRTPILKLSDLEVGMYTFILKVTDTADQSSTSEVHVFVQPGNEGPTADAGLDREINLPLNWILLDGSKSHDDVQIQHWEWKQVSGPSQTQIENATAPIAKATGLTKGIYVYQLTVSDEKQASTSKTVTVTVKQSKNDPPRANAGGDKTVTISDSNLVTLNGSSSVDDVTIVRFEWVRDSSSLAAGDILENTDHSSVLMLTNLIPGHYLFRLTVVDGEGLSDTDSASLIVKPAIREKDDIIMFIATDIYSFAEEQKLTLAKKLALLSHEDAETTVHIKKVEAARNAASVALTFHVEKTLASGEVVVLPGVRIVHQLKQRLRMDSGLLDVIVTSLETVVCQNNCSNHGMCDQFTKQCVCEAFWMENVFKLYLGDKESNCDWSILYVIVLLFVTVIIFGGLVWGLICFMGKKPWKKCCYRKISTISNSSRVHRPRRHHRYTLLDNFNDKEAAEMLPKGKPQSSSVMVSDSDSEAVLFEKQNGSVQNGTTNGLNRSPSQIPI